MTRLTKVGANALLVSFTDSRLVRALLRSYTRPHGGAWVGGAFEVTDVQVSFTTNIVNRTLHGRRADTSIPLHAIQKVTVVSGLGTDIVVVHTDAAVLQVRVWRAQHAATVVVDAVNIHAVQERPLRVERTSGETFQREFITLLTAVAGLT